MSAARVGSAAVEAPITIGFLLTVGCAAGSFGVTPVAVGEPVDGVMLAVVSGPECLEVGETANFGLAIMNNGSVPISLGLDNNPGFSVLMTNDGYGRGSPKYAHAVCGLNEFLLKPKSALPRKIAIVPKSNGDGTLRFFDRVRIMQENGKCSEPFDIVVDLPIHVGSCRS